MVAQYLKSDYNFGDTKSTSQMTQKSRFTKKQWILLFSILMMAHYIYVHTCPLQLRFSMTFYPTIMSEYLHYDPKR